MNTALEFILINMTGILSLLCLYISLLFRPVSKIAPSTLNEKKVQNGEKVFSWSAFIFALPHAFFGLQKVSTLLQSHLLTDSSTKFSFVLGIVAFFLLMGIPLSSLTKKILKQGRNSSFSKKVTRYAAMLVLVHGMTIYTLKLNILPLQVLLAFSLIILLTLEVLTFRSKYAAAQA